MKRLFMTATCAVTALLALSCVPATYAQAPSPSATAFPTPTASARISVSPSNPTQTTPASPLQAGNSPTPTPSTSTQTSHASPAEAIHQHWQSMGGTSGVLGEASSGLVPLRDGAFVQFYRGGQIYWTPQYGAHASRAGIHAAYGAYTWENGPLGFPTSDETVQTLAGIRGAVQTYENGEIRWSSRGGAHPIWGKVLERYTSAENEGRSLGWPLVPERKDAAHGGTYQHFTAGSIYFHPRSGAHRVTGAIRHYWHAQGWERGLMGYPTGEEMPAQKSGVSQSFQGGTAYWHPSTGVHLVHDGMLAAYAKFGYESGRYGYPLSDETPSANGGVFQRFQGGTAYWHPGSQSYFVHGAIMGAYAASRWEHGELGYPLSAETPTVKGGVIQRFQGGTAYWSPRTGAYAVPGDLLAEYGRHGFERGHLGYPVGPAYWEGNLHKQRFEHGILDNTNDFNVTWAGQPNNYFCGPTSGWMILNAIGAHHSAQGTPLSINAVASREYMNTVGYGYTSFHDRRFEYGMNRWLGRDAYTTIHTPSVEQVRDSVKSSFSKGLPTAVDAQERRGGPHYNGHPNSTFSHIMVVTSYDANTDSIRIADPGVHYLWGGEEQFWYHLPSFTQNFLQTEVERDGREHIGIYSAR